MADVGVAGVKKIFLPEMAKLCADGDGDLRVIIDDQVDAGSIGDWHNRFSRSADVIHGGSFRSKLNYIGAASAKLLGDLGGISSMQVSSVNEGVKLALRKRFHYTHEKGPPGQRIWRRLRLFLRSTRVARCRASFR